MNALRDRVGARWDAIPRGTRIAIAVVGALLALNLVALIADAAGDSDQGPPSSPASTSADGLAAYASLLGRFGHPSRTISGDLDTHLDPGSTLVVLQPSALSPPEIERLRAFTESGGRLVIGGSELSPGELIVDDPPAASPEPADDDVDPAFAPAGAPSDFRRVDTAGLGSWRSEDTGEGTGALLVDRALGSGEVLLLADPTALQNDFLGRADNAGFALALAGGPGRPVLLAEPAGGSGRGLGALPGQWRLALALLALAALLWLAASVRRIGAPDGSGASPAPPRGAYVEAMGALLSRSGDDDRVVAAMREAAMRSLSRRGVRLPDSTAALVRAAVARGASAGDAAALAGETRPGDRVEAAGRALAAVGEDPSRVSAERERERVGA